MSAAPLPDGWIVQYDPNTKRNFYASTATGKVQWEPPVAQQLAAPTTPNHSGAPGMLAPGMLGIFRDGVTILRYLYAAGLVPGLCPVCQQQPVYPGHPTCSKTCASKYQPTPATTTPVIASAPGMQTPEFWASFVTVSRSCAMCMQQGQCPVFALCASSNLCILAIQPAARLARRNTSRGLIRLEC